MSVARNESSSQRDTRLSRKRSWYHRRMARDGEREHVRRLDRDRYWSNAEAQRERTSQRNRRRDRESERARRAAYYAINQEYIREHVRKYKESKRTMMTAGDWAKVARRSKQR